MWWIIGALYLAYGVFLAECAARKIAAEDRPGERGPHMVIALCAAAVLWLPVIIAARFRR